MGSYVFFDGVEDLDKFVYIWEVSDDKVNWVQRGHVKVAKFEAQNWNGCDGILSFINNVNEHYKYWRVQIRDGKITKAPYFNIMLMTIA